ncbi:mechanosensitive ion channel [bacterium]|nr:mechanosensitive ion channel [bacterium]
MKNKLKINLFILLALILVPLYIYAQDSTWVEVRGIKLFEVDQPYKNFSVERRAKVANTKLNKIVTDPNIKEEELTVELNDDFEIIVNGQTNIIAVGPNDVTGKDISRSQLAEQWASQIEQGIIDAKRKYSNWRAWSRMILAVILPVIFVIVLWLVHWLFQKLSRHFVKLEGEKITGLKLKEKQIISGRSIVVFFIKSLRVVKWIFYVIAFYFFLIIFFNIFPLTKVYTQTLINFTVEILKEIGLVFLAIFKPVLGAVLLIIIGGYLFSLINHLYNKLKEHEIEFSRLPDTLLLPMKRVLKSLVVIAILFCVLALIPGVRGLYMFIVFAILLCFTIITLIRPAINLFSSLIILGTREIAIGDEIQIAGYKGKVKEVKVIYTVLETEENTEINVPNYLFLKNIFRKNKENNVVIKKVHDEDLY